MLSAVLKAKYHPYSPFWIAKSTATKSVFWSSILQVKQELTKNCTLQIHSGNSSIWSTPWCPIWENIHDHVNLPYTQLPLPATVSQLWEHDSCNWDVNYISSIFDNQAMHEISSLTVIPSPENDMLRWAPARDGKCTTKSIYRHLSCQDRVQLPGQGPRSVTHHANFILQKAWRSKDLPPLIKTFTWRLIRRALATGDRAGRYNQANR